MTTMALTLTTPPLLSERTTLKLGGPCLAEVVAARPQDLLELPEVLARQGGSPRVLGYGSNILAAGGEAEAVLVRPAIMQPPAVREKHDSTMLLRVGAGVRLPKLVAFTAMQGLAGLSGLAGIPGTVGGAVAMNAGSYGAETKDHLERVLVYSLDAGLAWYGRDELEPGYRSFAIPSLHEAFRVICAVEFRLPLADEAAVKAEIRANLARKRASQPVRAASAGCVFKNPEGSDPAGKLLDQAGFKGKTLGGMAFSTLHANFLVNSGGGTAAQAMELIEQARCAVKDRFDVTLQLEVEVWP